MTTLNTLSLRARMQLGDTNLQKISPYEITDALNETIRELRKTVTQYYTTLSFTVPAKGAKTNTDDSGWPDEFDELMVDYACILLTPADFSTKKQLKEAWRSWVMRQTAQYNSDDTGYTVKDYFDLSKDEVAT